jgi:long-chain acyl-CoA synthetase
LAEFLRKSPLPATRESHVALARKTEHEEEIKVPSLVVSMGNVGLELAQNFLYNKILETEIKGKANIPCYTNFIVAPNHCSHLDMGLVKTALGDAGKNMAAVAAADYFFDTKYKRAFFENFTNLIPMERQGSLHESLKLATQSLHQGYNLLIFPEGTRSVNGEMAEFKFSLGYLALRAKRGILPMHLAGTHELMPKGSSIPKKGKVTASIGPFLSFEDLQKLTNGIPKNDGYRLITALVQKIVEQMRDGIQPVVNIDEIRNQWSRENLPQLEKTASAMAD